MGGVHGSGAHTYFQVHIHITTMRSLLVRPDWEWVISEEQSETLFS